MVLSDEQKQALLERLKKGKEKKAQEKAQLEKQQLKKEDVKEVEVNSTFKEINEDIKPPIEDINKKSIPIDEAFSNLPKKEKVEKVEKLEKKTKEKPYLKIKLYKEPSNPDLINNLVDTLNNVKNQKESKTDKETESEKTVQSNSIKEPVQNIQNRYIEERNKKLAQLCKLYFN